MIRLTEHPSGVCLPVRVQAGARRDELRGDYAGALKVAVTQVAEKGKANQAIHRLLCKQLGLRKSQLSLICGETANQKIFLVGSISLGDLQRRIHQALRIAGHPMPNTKGGAMEY